MGKWFPPQVSTAERILLTPDDGSIFYDEDEQMIYIGDGSTVGGLSLIGPQGPQGEPGTLTAVKDDTSPQLGGFLDPDGNYVGSDKGSDIASASPLVLGTDGDYFDITGTTGFSTITVAANRIFILQFNSALVITNGASIVIPGGANFTTSPGDQIFCYSIAVDTVRIVAVTKADGTPVALNLSQDTSPQLGGFLNPNGNYVGSSKGGDIASASPLVLGTDGDYFDITGTTGFSTITVAANRRFRCQFDGALVITVGSGITLNNDGANFTTSPGDSIDFQSVAANVVVGTIIKKDGTAVVVAPGGTAIDNISNIRLPTIENLNYFSTTWLNIVNEFHITSFGTYLFQADLYMHHDGDVQAFGFVKLFEEITQLDIVNSERTVIYVADTNHGVLRVGVHLHWLVNITVESKILLQGRSDASATVGTFNNATGTSMFSYIKLIN